MARRYRHYMDAAKSDRWPSRILCVACDVDVDSGSPSGRPLNEELVSWSCAKLARKDKTYVQVAEFGGTTQCSWWTWVIEQSDKDGYTWIVSYRAARDWSLLGLWERIEDGTIYTVGHDHRAAANQDSAVRKLRDGNRGKLQYPSAGAVSRLCDRGAGYIVCQDPPNIVRLRAARSKRWVQWIDTRNYGVECSSEVTDAIGVCAWIANAVQGISDAFHAAKLGSLQATVSSQAMHGFRRSYYSGGIYVHSHEPSLGIESAAYYGGRCECYHIGAAQAPLWHTDIRSSYGARMATESVPVRLRGYTDNPGRCETIGRDTPECCIATVGIKTDEEAYPYRRDEDIIYPIGRFHTTLAGPELADCVRAGRIVQWIALAWYDCEPALRDYADTIYEMRCNAERRGMQVISGLAKRLLVSLPGKFGQKDRRWVDCSGHNTDQQWGEWWGADDMGNPCRYRAIAGHVQRDDIAGWTHNACPMIAAWITSAGRMALLRYIRQAGWNHVYYCDTDSLMVDEHGYRALAINERATTIGLGQMYRKGGPNHVILRGAKHYTEGTRTVCAGLPEGNVQYDVGSKAYWRYLSPAEQIRRGYRPAAQLIQSRYDRHDEYTARVVLTDGTTRPIELRE